MYGAMLKLLELTGGKALDDLLALDARSSGFDSHSPDTGDKDVLQ